MTLAKADVSGIANNDFQYFRILGAFAVVIETTDGKIIAFFYSMLASMTLKSVIRAGKCMISGWMLMTPLKSTMLVSSGLLLQKDTSLNICKKEWPTWVCHLQLMENLLGSLKY